MHSMILGKKSYFHKVNFQESRIKLKIIFQRKQEQSMKQLKCMINLKKTDEINTYTEAYRCHKITTYMSSSSKIIFEHTDMFLKKFRKLYQDLYILLVILIGMCCLCLNQLKGVILIRCKSFCY